MRMPLGKIMSLHFRYTFSLPITPAMLNHKFIQTAYNVPTIIHVISTNIEASMFPSPLRYQPDDAPHQKRYRWLMKPFLIMLLVANFFAECANRPSKLIKPYLLMLLVASGLLFYPYGSLVVYPHGVFATIPVPANATRIASESIHTFACNTSSIVRVYSTDSSIQELTTFYTTYVHRSSAWTLIDSDAPSVPDDQRFWRSKRVLWGWNTQNRSLFLTMQPFPPGAFNADVADAAQQAQIRGKTVYYIRISYINNLERLRAARDDKASECFRD
jgi:hypothetical protein